MTLYEIFMSIGVVGGVALGLFNWINSKRTVKQTELTSTGDYLLDANESIAIANKRALDAERERREAEIQHKQEISSLKLQLADLQTRLERVEKALAYEIRLVAHLGEDPKIEAISIKRIPVDK